MSPISGTAICDLYVDPERCRSTRPFSAPSSVGVHHVVRIVTCLIFGRIVAINTVSETYHA